MDGEGGVFRNCEEVRGNIVVVTSGRVEFVELAGMARDCEVRESGERKRMAKEDVMSKSERTSA